MIDWIEIDPRAILTVRKRTGLPMLACRQALCKEDGDIEKAIQRLRREHKPSPILVDYR